MWQNTERLENTTVTDYLTKIEILADLWINFKGDEQFEDFFEYNDLGMPLAYYIHTEIVKSTDQAQMYIEETFSILCASLELDLDGDYESLNDMFDKSPNV